MAEKDRGTLGIECAKKILDFFTQVHDDPNCSPSMFPVDLGEIYSTPEDLAKMKPLDGHRTEGPLGIVYGIQVQLYMVVIRKTVDKIIIIEINLLHPSTNFIKELDLPPEATDGAAKG